MLGLVLAVSLSQAQCLPVAKQMQLKEGMALEVVRETLGDPVKTESTTCGVRTKSPWSCRIWTYPCGFKVTFQEFGKSLPTWFVNSWG